MRKTYFITGVTGFVGREILRILADGENLVYCFLRSSSSQSAEDRFKEVLHDLRRPDAPNIFLVSGDIRKEMLGIEPREYDKLTRDVTNIIHSAADVRFNQPLERMREINVEGTRRILDFAESCARNNPTFSHLDYVSTAFVAGRCRGLFTESDFEHEFGFKNAYEQSKHEAERLVRERAKALAVVIYRPSIVLGFSENGYARNRNVIYPMLKLFTRWNVPVVSANRRTRLDIVPVDFAARALLHLSDKEESRGKCYALAAGPGGDITLGDLIEVLREEFNKKVMVMPPIFWRVVVRPLLKTFKRDFYETSTGTFRAFEPYIWEMNPRYPVEETRKALEGSGIGIPDSDKFLRACFRYAITSDFGERHVEQ